MLRFIGSAEKHIQASLVHLVEPTVCLRSGVSRIGAPSNLLTCELVKPQRFPEITQRCQNLRFFAVRGGQGVKISVSLLLEIDTVIDALESLREASSSIQLVREIIEHGGLLFLDRILPQRM